jgi:hypothetical protein
MLGTVVDGKEHPLTMDQAARPPSTWSRIAAGLAVVAALAAGIVVLGRLAATDTVATVLTAGWFALVAGVAGLAARARRWLLVPVAAGWAVSAVAAGALLGLPMLTDREVDEQVVQAAPGPAPAATPAPAEPAPAANVALASGTFAPVAHQGRGTATLVRLAEGGRVLTLTGFATDNGPDLRLYLATGDPGKGGELGRFVDLGALKGNRGNQQYRVPGDLDASRYSTVVVWCRAFSVPFTSARLA